MPHEIKLEGWTLRVPSIRVEPSDAKPYVDHLRSMGVGNPEVTFHEACQQLFAREWKDRVLAMLKRRRRQYVEIHGTDEGFNPEVLQGAYVPGLSSPGRQGDSVVRRILVKMGEGRDDSA